MSTIYDKIKERLEKFPDFRERRFREKYLVILSLRQIGLENKERQLTNAELVDFAHTYTSYDRLWRKCLLDNPGLRGNDWEDRREYEETTMLGLGYEPDFFNNVRRLKAL